MSLEEESVFLRCYFPPPPLTIFQIPSEGIAHVDIYSKDLHFRALTNSFRVVENKLSYTKYQLENFHSYINFEQFADQLVSGIMQLEGLLDGLMIFSHPTPSHGLTFKNAEFPDARMEELRQEMLYMISIGDTDSDTYTDFWSIANFWKHYYPFIMIPTKRKPYRCCDDVYVKLSHACYSGPLMHDIFIPIFNTCRDLLDRAAKIHNFKESIPPKIQWSETISDCLTRNK
jgi:hypothetical protein